jgi:hypothetical protein
VAFNQDDTHLLRVRIKKSLFDGLKRMADEESDRVEDNVTVSDLARAALVNHLKTYDSKRKLLALSQMAPDILLLLSPADLDFSADDEEDELVDRYYGE